MSERGPDFPALSPDGHHLGYGEEDDMFVRPVSGGDAVSVASGPSKDVLVGWTEDGNLLYFSDRWISDPGPELRQVERGQTPGPDFWRGTGIWEKRVLCIHAGHR